MPLRKVQVTWLDANTEDGWEDLELSPLKPDPCETLGHVIEETAEGITLCATLSNNGKKEETNSRICIPRGFIVRIDDITVNGTR